MTSPRGRAALSGWTVASREPFFLKSIETLKRSLPFRQSVNRRLPTSRDPMITISHHRLRLSGLSPLLYDTGVMHAALVAFQAKHRYSPPVSAKH
jgi:hypothetical protein